MALPSRCRVGWRVSEAVGSSQFTRDLFVQRDDLLGCLREDNISAGNFRQSFHAQTYLRRVSGNTRSRIKISSNGHEIERNSRPAETVQRSGEILSLCGVRSAIDSIRQDDDSAARFYRTERIFCPVQSRVVPRCPAKAWIPVELNLARRTPVLNDTHLGGKRGQQHAVLWSLMPGEPCHRIIDHWPVGVHAVAAVEQQHQVVGSIRGTEVSDFLELAVFVNLKIVAFESSEDGQSDYDSKRAA